MGPKAIGAGIFLGLAAAGTASAQEKLCAGTYREGEWVGAMDAGDSYMAAFKLKEARVTLYAARELVPCLDAVIKPSLLGRFARQIALLEFLSQDEDTAVRWAKLSVAVAPKLPWPADIPEDHPFRELVTTSEPAPLVGPSDKGFAIEPGSAPFLNGTFILFPQAYSEVSNLFQLTDKTGKLTSAYWIDGAAFNELLLGEAGKVPKQPKWWTAEPEAAVTSMVLPLVFGAPAVADGGAEEAPAVEPKNAAPAPAPVAGAAVAVAPAAGADGWTEARVETPAPTKVAPAPQPATVAASTTKPSADPKPEPAAEPRPAIAAAEPAPKPEPAIAPEKEPREAGSGPKVALLGAGGGSAAVAGVLFAVAALSHGGLDEAASEDDLVGVRSRTNGLALGASIVSAAAIGLTATAFVADDGWAFGLNRRF